MESQQFLTEMVLAGLTVLSEKADKSISELTVLELEKIMRYLTWELQQQPLPESQLDKLYFTKDEAAKILRISYPQLNVLMKQGKISYHKIGERRVVFTLEDLMNSGIEVKKTK